jgi:Tfp pilus assembly protein PilF
MTSSLLQSLLQFYEEDPNDPFNTYALALEYSKSDLARAETLFRKLLTEHPKYLPAYYHAARLLADRGKVEEAASTYQKGMALAKELGNAKIQRELTGAYQLFMDEQEDE